MQSTTQATRQVEGGAMPEEIKRKAIKWFDAQMAKAEKAHGRNWGSNRAWIADYLKQELLERLQKNGWRPNHDTPT